MPDHLRPMDMPNLTHFDLREDVLREPGSADRINLWIRGIIEADVQLWQRVSTLSGVEIDQRSGFCVAGAMLIPFQQEILGFLDRLKSRLKRTEAADSWVTPDGHTVKPIAKKRTDVILVWTENASEGLEHNRIKSHWPSCDECVQLGSNLFLVIGGVEAHATASQTNRTQRLQAREEHFEELSRPENDPLIQAKKSLDTARSKRDPNEERIALADLGAVLVRKGDAREGVDYLEQALDMAKQVDDVDSEFDILSNIGIGYLGLERISEAKELFETVLTRARTTGDAFSEKMMLTQIGIAVSIIGDPRRALDHFEAARKLAHDLKDLRDEAELNWSIAVCHEELGDRELALQFGQDAVDIFRRLESPRAPAYAEHLERFRSGHLGLGNLAQSDDNDSESIPSWAMGGPQIDMSTLPSGKASRPSFLKMAYSLSRSMARFAASGFKTVSREANQERLKVCSQCEQHTGIRCKLCGCFTAQKAWLPHEHCPINKWPV